MHQCTAVAKAAHGLGVGLCERHAKGRLQREAGAGGGTGRLRRRNTSRCHSFSIPKDSSAPNSLAGVLNTTAGLVLTPAALDLRRTAPCLVFGGVGYGASLLLYIRGAQQLGATRSQLVFSTAPAFGLGLRPRSSES